MKLLPLFALLLSCSSPKAPEYDLITITQRVPGREEIFVIKYLDMNHDGKVDFYGYGYGEETDIASNPYSIIANEHFYVSASYADANSLKPKENLALKVMSSDMEARVNTEYNQQKSYAGYLENISEK